MTIEEVFRQAKRTLMQLGHHAPLIIAETENQLYLMPPPLSHWNGSTWDKEKGLFLLGRAFAKDNYETAEDVHVIFLITESWFVSRSNETDLKKIGRPGDQPDRREGINVLELRLIEKRAKQSMHMAEIIRYGNLIDLLPHETPEDIHSMLLPCFLAGVISADRSDASLVEMLQRYREVGEF